ncbi:MAG: hypothetical protein QNJ47_12380 [Nostocaceae cyanobacterium]|nr:hypothetical protein [Nostocaceae cyanobacterium]
MRRTDLPVVDTCITEDCIHISSEDWYKWLRKVKSFRYTSQFHPITLRNRNKDYWYAYRQFAGKLRQRYLCKTQDLDYERLQLVAEELSKPDWEYWNQISDIGS